METSLPATSFEATGMSIVEKMAERMVEIGRSGNVLGPMEISTERWRH